MQVRYGRTIGMHYLQRVLAFKLLYYFIDIVEATEVSNSIYRVQILKQLIIYFEENKFKIFVDQIALTKLDFTYLFFSKESLKVQELSFQIMVTNHWLLSILKVFGLMKLLLIGYVFCCLLKSKCFCL